METVYIETTVVSLLVARPQPGTLSLEWNCKHLANAVIQRRLQPAAESRGFKLPQICLPFQLMGPIEYED